MRRRFVQSASIVVIIAASVAPVTLASAQQSSGNSAPVHMPGPAPTPTAPATVAPTAAVPVPEAPLAPTVIRPLAVSPGIGPLSELSPWRMFLAADVLVKAVMIGLAFASLVTWTLFFAKTIQLSGARRRLDAALAKVADARSLKEAQATLGQTRNVIGALVAAALHEIRQSGDDSGKAGIKERAASRFLEIQRLEASAVRHGMSIIATIGATAPFVGLFGTVWGIMNSFIGISKAQTTNLAVVAPGIAEALLATAIGLVAAIPAVIIYNHFARVTKGYLELVSRSSGAAARLLSRDLDRTHVSSPRPANARAAE
jgi:biopolymer transport protein ExbB